jgi:serine/threonine protein kinase
MTNPSRRTFGPYQVIETLGIGGTGLVLRAVSESSGEVALKVARGEEASRQDELRREIGILRRLNRAGIRGVVRIIEHGVDRGEPWYAMELLEGHSLRYWSQRLWAAQRPDGDPPEGLPRRVAASNQLERVLHLLLRVAEILTQLHNEGVVHGDLTPGNIVFRDETDPVLIDFGMALAAIEGEPGREPPIDLACRGTPGYVAPEIISGEPMDARCDLYSFGCVAYELLTGDRAFGSDQRRDVLRQQLHTTPEAPSRLVHGLPPGLDELVLGLLERDPIRRISHATDVCRALRRHLRQPPAVLREHREDTPLFRSRLHGRDQARLQLSDLLKGLDHRRGGLVLLRGPSGIGKTRLFNEVARSAGRLGVHVCWCAGRRMALSDGEGTKLSSSGVEMFEPLLQGIRSEFLQGRLDEASAAAYRDLAALVPALATGEDAPAVRLGLSSEEVRKRGLAGLDRLLRDTAPPNGLLLLIDDLHWADDLSLQFLRSHSAALAGSRVLIVANSRSDASNEALTALATLSLASIDLGLLETSAIRAMLKDLLATTVLPDGLFEFIQGHGSGNPFFVTEYTRAAITRGLLRRNGDSEWSFDTARAGEFELPASIEGLLELRVRSLSEPARAALRWGCVFGEEFDAEAFRILSPQGFDPTEVLEELVAREVLAVTTPGRYRFAHDQLREGQQRLLSDVERREAHLRVATYLQEGGSAWLADRAAALGYHLACADSPELALENLRLAAARAEECYSVEQATELYRLAIRQVELCGVAARSEILSELREKLAEVLTKQARHAEARACLELLSNELPPSDRLGRARTRRKIAASFWTLHDYAAAAQSLDQAEDALGALAPTSDLPHWTEFIQIRLGRFEQLYFSGQSGARLDELMCELTPLIDRYGSADQRCVYYFTAASHAMLSRRYVFDEEALVLAQRGLDAAASLTPRRKALAHFILGFALTLGTRDQCRAAVVEFQNATTLAELANEATLLSRVRTYHAISLLRLSDVDGTARAATLALTSAEIARLPPYIAAAQACLGWVAWKRNAAGAPRLLESARETFSRHSHKFPFQSLTLFPLLEMAGSRDDLPGARALLEELSAGLPGLPPPLVRAVDAARTAIDGSDAREAARAIDAVVTLAQKCALA